MRNFKITVAAISAALLVAACGGGGGGPLGTQVSAPTRGQLMQSPPPRITALTAADFTASLQAGGASGRGLLAVAGTPTCGVDVQYIKYGTVGGAGEATTASGALMVPTGSAAACTGARPILVYAHGTNPTKSFNMANWVDPTNPAYSESLLVAAMFAAQGYIVVAPNYAGYDSSTLGYHPYLNADQQSKEMIDALKAAKAALPTLLSPTTASAKLFVSGYSQGGHVAMATQRAMEAAGIVVTAAAPMSGPYAMSVMSDAIFAGDVDLGSTEFLPLITTSYQKAYNNLYTTPSDIYESNYATGIETLMPGTFDDTTLFSSGKLPLTALFNSTPPDPMFASITPPTGTGATDALFALGFGTSNLIKNSARLAYLMDAMANPDQGFAPAAAPASPFRQAAKINDLRTGWATTGTPMKAPMLLCGGNGDPTVFWQANAQVMQAVWAPYVAAGLVTVLDVDSLATSSGPATDPFYAAKAGFAQLETATATAAATAAGGGAAGAAAAAMAVTVAYHGGLVPPFCTAAARGFFSQF